MLEKTAISDSQTVDKTENANNNEIKILVLPPDSIKSQQDCVFRQSCAKILNGKCETLASFRYF